MAPTEPRNTDYPYEGLAERVHVTRHGTQYNEGLSFVLAVCDECGALLVDQERHDNFHDRLDIALGIDSEDTPT